MQTLGLLVGLTLRNPANAERAVEEGCVDVVIEVWTHSASSLTSKGPDVLRWNSAAFRRALSR